jgi:hypothetical protein
MREAAGGLQPGVVEGEGPGCDAVVIQATSAVAVKVAVETTIATAVTLVIGAAASWSNSGSRSTGIGGNTVIYVATAR